MNFNLNMQLIPLDSLSFRFLDFNLTNSDEPFNDKFEDQDIFQKQAMQQNLFSLCLTLTLPLSHGLTVGTFF
jgi:hypothetical protein